MAKFVTDAEFARMTKAQHLKAAEAHAACMKASTGRERKKHEVAARMHVEAVDAFAHTRKNPGEPLKFTWRCCKETDTAYPVPCAKCPNCGRSGPCYSPGDEDPDNAMCLPCWRSSAVDPQGHGQVCDGDWKNRGLTVSAPTPRKNPRIC